MDLPSVGSVVDDDLAFGNRCYCSARSDPTSIVVASILCLSLIETLYQYVMVAIRAKFLEVMVRRVNNLYNSLIAIKFNYFYLHSLYY